MLKVVYTAIPGADLREAVAHLRSAGLHPVVLDDPDPDGALQVASGLSTRIRIAVPEGERSVAARVLRAVARHEPESTRALARSFERAALKFVLSCAAFGGLVAIGNRVAPDLPWIGVFWALVALLTLVWSIRIWRRD